MNSKNSNYFDRLIGSTILPLLDRSVKLFNLRKSLPKIPLEPKKIIVCKLLGFGAIIQMTPMLQSLRKSFPHSEITFITTSRNLPLISLFPFIDRSLYLDDSSVFRLTLSLIVCLSNLWKTKSDIYIDCEVHSHFSSLIAGLTNSQYRLGLHAPQRKLLKNIYHAYPEYHFDEPLQVQYKRILSILNTNITVTELHMFTNLGDKIRDPMQLKPSTASPIILININASDLRKERQWPIDYFSELIIEILDKHPSVQVVLTGTQEEVYYVDFLLETIPNNKRNKIISSAGKLSLLQLINLTNRATLLISNDSGPLHLGLAQKVFTIGLFGPCDPAQFGSYPNSHFFYKRVDCSPCVHLYEVAPCNGNNICMQGIQVQEVLAVVEGILKQK